MRCTVCTLFEGKYHTGVAVLVNSLVRAGFTGEFHAGFRGPLPAWAEGKAKPRDPGTWEMHLETGLCLILTRLETEAHFANFKPTYMLDLFERTDADVVLYCDPDVVVDTTWAFISDWLCCGVTLCDDVNSPMPENHPHRVGWRRFYRDTNVSLSFRGTNYANAGVVGVRREHRRLLEVWKRMLADIAQLLGGADRVNITGGKRIHGTTGFADCFHQPDQDTLNAALEACREIPLSFLGRQAMGFEPGTPLLPHATGTLKPWTRRYFREALGGRAPSRVDKSFWRAAEGPLTPFSPTDLASARRTLAAAAALGRFIRRT